MATTTHRRTAAVRSLFLALAATAAVAGSPAAASSVIVVGAAGTTEGQAATVATMTKRASPAACADAFHARFGAIREREFAALKVAAGADVGASDAALPGVLIFPPAGRSQPGGNAAALRTAADLAKARGRTVGPLDANARWIAARIREDLGDFLSQKETPFLCSGIDAYLTTLRAQAARIGQSPDRLAALVETQREAARVSLDAARTALRPAPLPRFAPDDRPGEALVASNLRSSVGFQASDVYGPVMRVATRQDVGVSEGSSDPDLPPMKPSEALASESDIARVIRDLSSRAETAGVLGGLAVAGTDPMQTGAIPAPGPSASDVRPSLTLLVELRQRLVQPSADPLQRADFVRALSDLEALDYLMAAAAAPSHPLPAALEATFSAIETAHADSCGCKG